MASYENKAVCQDIEIPLPPLAVFDLDKGTLTRTFLFSLVPQTIVHNKCYRLVNKCLFFLHVSESVQPTIIHHENFSRSPVHLWCIIIHAKMAGKSLAFLLSGDTLYF